MWLNSELVSFFFFFLFAGHPHCQAIDRTLKEPSVIWLRLTAIKESLRESAIRFAQFGEALFVEHRSPTTHTVSLSASADEMHFQFSKSRRRVDAKSRCEHSIRVVDASSRCKPTLRRSGSRNNSYSFIWCRLHLPVWRRFTEELESGIACFATLCLQCLSLEQDAFANDF